MDWSYIAGLFDGEGNPHTMQLKKKSGKVSIHLLCRIYSSSDPVLLEIQKFIGFGQIYRKKSTGIFELTISNKEDNYTFLKNIFPYCIIKREQIDYILKNYNFNLGESNSSFDWEKAKSFSVKIKSSQKYKAIREQTT